MTHDIGDKGWSFAAVQKSFIETLRQGPSALPKSLFSGTPERTILGLKTHANTISHARLVALEETFPRLRRRLGETRFNALSRAYVERPDVLPCSLLQIGGSFPDYLLSQKLDLQSVELARIEWNCLESYHAPDATALEMGEIAGLDEAGLLDLLIALHPSVRVVRLTTCFAPELAEIISGDIESAHSIMISRPEADVRLMLITVEQCAVVEAMQQISNKGNLLAFVLETYGEASALPLVFGLCEAGVICKADNLVLD